MASQKSLDALKAAHEALQDMQLQLEPLLEMLLQDHDSTTTTPHQRALARAGIALTLGTVRFLGAKFMMRSSCSSHANATTDLAASLSSRPPSAAINANAQLRSELNHMRKLLVQVRQRSSSDEADNSSRSNSKEKEELVAPNNEESKQKIPSDDQAVDKITVTPPVSKRKGSPAAGRTKSSSSKRKKK